MPKNTILYIGSIDFTRDGPGINRTWVVGKMLRECGYEMAVIGADRSLETYTPILDTKQPINGFTCYTNPRRDFLYSIQSIVTVVESIGAESVAAIIAINYPAIPLNGLNQYCNKHHIPFIVECTEWYAANRGNLAYRAFKWLDIQLRMRYVCKKVRNIIAISRFLEKYYEKSGCNVHYLPSIVDRDDPKWDIEPYSYDGDVRRFVYAGGVKNDGLGYFLPAFRQIMERGSRFELHIFGVTKADLLSQVPTLGNDLEYLDKQVEFHGWVSHKDVVRFVKGADFTIFIREKNRVNEAGFPTKFAESLAAGTPPITNNRSDVAEHLIHGQNGLLIETCTVENITRVLFDAIQMDERQIEQMKTNCRAYDQLDYRNHIEALNRYLESLIAGSA